MASIPVPAGRATVAAPSEAPVRYEVVPGVAWQAGSAAAETWKRCGLGDLEREQHLRRYDWFYCKNPQGEGQVNFLHCASEVEPIGFLGMGARNWSVCGRDVKAGVLVDFVVHPKHRTALPALKLQRYGRERGAQTAQILIGLPDVKAVPIFKRLGAQFGFDLWRYVRITRYGAYLRRYLPGPLAALAGAVLDALGALEIAARLAGTEFDGAWVHEFDDRFDALWAALDKKKLCVGVRDRRFLSWRFSAQPCRSYRTFAVTRRTDGALQMYFVCEMSGNSLVVKDLLGLGDEAAWRVGLLLLSRAARKLGAAVVSIQVKSNDVLASALRTSRFVPRDSRPFFAMVDGPTATNMAGASWYITQADEDI